MKRILILCLICSLIISGHCFAKEYDLENMNSIELNDLMDLIDDELRANHKANSDQQSAVQDEIVAFVESFYGEDNVSWAWFDYSYSREWDYFSMTTHADIKKQDGGKAEYDIYGEVLADGDDYQVIYVKVGSEILLDERSSSISDARVRSMLELEAQSETATPESTDAPVEPMEEAAVVAIAQRGDKNETVKSIQEMLIRLNYLSGNADGDFGGKTATAVQAFQKDNGFPEDGIVTQEVFDALSAAFAAAPVPVEYPRFTAVELYKKFEVNQLSAEAELEGKEIQITGTIDAISETIWGTPYVSLRADSYGFTSVQCYFSTEQINELTKLRTGNKVTIQGTCGTMSILTVDVKDCTVIG